MNSGQTITVRELDLGLNGNFRPVLRRVKTSGETNLVLDCSTEKLPEVLLQAQQVNISRLGFESSYFEALFLVVLFCYTNKYFIGRINVRSTSIYYNIFRSTYY